MAPSSPDAGMDSAVMPRAASVSASSGRDAASPQTDSDTCAASVQLRTWSRISSTGGESRS